MERSTKPAIPHGLIAVVLALPIIVIGVQSLRSNHLISGCVLTLAGLGLFTYGVRRADASPALNPIYLDAARRHAPMLLAITVGLLLWAGVLSSTRTSEQFRGGIPHASIATLRPVVQRYPLGRGRGAVPGGAGGCRDREVDVPVPGIG